MAKKHPRVFGTTDAAIDRAEQELGRSLPPSFRRWLLSNNGHHLEYITIFPVLDDRDPRMTWDSIVRNIRENWAGWLENFDDEDPDFSHLLPFGDFGSGDYYCFDFSQDPTEPPVVMWSHETGDTAHRAENFTEFLRQVTAGEISD